MKYSEKNPPLACMQTQSSCYRGTGKMQIKGVLWHDTGCSNPNLKRFVQPSDDAPDRAEWMERLGRNPYHNDWNHVARKAGMNCWIGKLADGTVATVQTMPWDYRPWGCGSGKKGSCNNGWIQFEICEDGKKDAEYFNKVYEEACEITAYLCKLYNIDPLGAAECGGVAVPTILCHQDSCKLGLGSNHSDIYDWFPKFGKNMDTVRQDVARLLAEGQNADETPIEVEPGKGENPDQNLPVQLDEQTIWNTLFSFIGNSYGAAGLMGNLYAESGLKANNLQNTGNKALDMTDEEYTAAVDSGTYAHFTDDRFGFGLAQWTYPSRKEELLAFARQRGVSIDDPVMQLDFLRQEISRYSSVMAALRSARSVKEASDIVLAQYEKPSDQSPQAKERRAAYGETYYKRFSSPVYYRVRRSWADKASQIGAFINYEYAKAAADKNPGFCVFDPSGKQVYPPVSIS